MADIQHQVLPNGSRIGVYEVRGVQLISHFSIIYKGWNHHLSTTMAIEEYLPIQFAMRAKDGRNVEPKSDSDRSNYDFGLVRFVEQAENLMKIEHPNIGGVHNVLQVNGTAYLAMDYEDGLPLARLCDGRKSKFDEDELKVIFIPVLKALQKVHEQGFFHGAVIPANILLRKDGEPVLINFAAARLALASQSGTLPMILSKGYAPIEQYHSDGQYGPWTDLYTLGATMYHCISGDTPEPAPERISALENDTPDPQASLLKAESSTYSTALLKTIDSMLAVHTQDRPPSAAAVLTALNADFQQPRESPAPTNEKAETLEEADSIPISPASKKDNRQRLLIGGGVGLATAMLLAAGVWYSGQRTDALVSDQKEQTFSNEHSQSVQSSDTALELGGQTTRDESEKSERSVASTGSMHAEHEALQTITTAQESLSDSSEDVESSPMLSQSTERNIANGESESVRMEPATSLEVVSGENEPEKQSELDAVVSPEPGLLSAADNRVRETSELGQPSVTQHEIKPTDRDLTKAPPHAQQSRRGEPIEANSVKSSSAAMRETVKSNTEQDPKFGLTPLPVPDKNLVSRPSAQPTDTSVSQQEVIEQHMAVAQQHLAALRLSTPPGENALEHFRAVLSLAPEHPGAQEGLEQIAIRYGWLIDKSIQEGEFRRARVYLKRAGEVLPGARNLQALRSDLEAAETAAQNMD